MKGFIVSLRELKWLQSATSRDTGYRPELGNGFTASFDGCAWLCATDTHRLHLLRLGPDDKVFSSRLVELQRLIVEAEYHGATHVEISRDMTTARVGKLAGNDDELVYSHPVHAPFTAESHSVPSPAKIIEGEKVPVSEFFAANIRYLADAFAMAGADQNRVVIYGKSRNQVHFIQPDDPAPRWMVALMPMAISSFWAMEDAS